MTKPLPFQSEWTLVKVTVTQTTVAQTEVRHSRISDKATAMRRGLMVVDAVSKRRRFGTAAGTDQRNHRQG